MPSLSALTIAAFRLLIRLRRYRELGLVALATVVGCLAGVVVTAMSRITNLAHQWLFMLPSGERLSEQESLVHPALALMPVVGGVLLALLAVATRRRLKRQPVDPIEANALHGGRMFIGESLLVALQTMISSGFGASVGLEAGYTQASSGFASRLAEALRLRRRDIRTLVGCAAAGAISAAFDAPITGAFYGFELIIGTYSVALVAPVLAASLAASLTADWLGAFQTTVEVGHVPILTASDLAPFLLLGLVGGLLAVAVMQLTTGVERAFRLARIPGWARPAIGGACVGGLALLTPHVLASGHGALHVALESSAGWQMLLALFVLKATASALSLGSGFRGGLFFASLYLGALVGKAYALILIATGLAPDLSPLIASVIGMASMAVGIVGGPMTMAFLVLETTGDLAIASAVLTASIVSAVVVRETFGYSFSTWRLHLRGETIRSANDIGRMRSLTVSRMMRSDVRTVSAGLSLDGFRAMFPLGSTQRAIAVDGNGGYAGIVVVADAYAPDTAEGRTDIAPFLRHREAMLLPSMTVADAAKLFEAANAEELAVVESPHTRKVIGLLTEQYLLRRYAEELDKARRDITGEG
ncbi:chloride channel protein [Pleomorphomonas sp. NRK KF1]|uniref:chloride channel protein n=1 Tax=Pleomorphomonas sp. NRK KF1 TaxID=2943000 RepID=UPI0020449402|nr:chloride channel protein [Pleomorphomonas sp. NRK KF1]MCM5554161.1 chloride channel protein [Pleomorphomonas sp. NRK KF1]